MVATNPRTRQVAIDASAQPRTTAKRVFSTRPTWRPWRFEINGAALDAVKTRRWLAFGVGLLFIALFMLERPYQGIRHDAILYTVQALHDLTPGNYRHDLFFAFGSQDQWTLYGKLYARLIAAIGIRDANLLGLAVSQILWWSGAWRLIRRLLPAPWHWIAVLFVIGMPADYADKLAFFYAEPYLTARVPAEGMCLWALSFAMERRLVPAFALSLASMTLHPLNGAVGFAAVLLVAATRFPWWRLFTGLLLVFALLQYGTPAGFAVHPLDAAWRGTLEAEIDYLFPSLWTLFAWSKACWVIAVPFLLHADARTTTLSRTPDHLWGRLALIGLSGMVCATLADIGGHDALWLQLQTWRVLWLLSVLQWPALIVLLRREWEKRPALLWWLALCWLTLEVGGGIVALGIAVLLKAATLMPRAGLAHVARFGGDSPSERYKAGLVALSVPAVATWAICQIGYGLGYVRSHGVSSATDAIWLDVLLHSRFMAALVALLCGLLLLGGRKAATAFALILAGLLSYGAINFDQRSKPMKIMESRLDDPSRAPFAAQVAPGRMVYWDGPWDELVYPWLLMRTASYFSPGQTSGIVFHRETTFEALRRAERIGDPGTDAASTDLTQIDRTAPQSDADIKASEDLLLARRENHFAPLSANGVRRACARTAHDATPIDFIVSPEHYAALMPEARWDASAAQQFWLYDCSKVDTLSSSSTPLRLSTRHRTDLVTESGHRHGGRHAIG